MGFAVGDTLYRKARTPAQKIAESDLASGIAPDPLLTWKAAMVMIYGAPRGYDAFCRLREGVWVGRAGEIGSEFIVLHVTKRPGCVLVRQSQAEVFCIAYEAAVARQEARERGDAAMQGRGSLSPATPHQKEEREDVRGREIGSRAYEAGRDLGRAFVNSEADVRAGVPEAAAPASADRPRGLRLVGEMQRTNVVGTRLDETG